jgi:hypothetical protein
MVTSVDFRAGAGKNLMRPQVQLVIEEVRCHLRVHIDSGKSTVEDLMAGVAAARIVKDDDVSRWATMVAWDGTTHFKECNFLNGRAGTNGGALCDCDHKSGVRNGGAY